MARKSAKVQREAVRINFWKAAKAAGALPVLKGERAGEAKAREAFDAFVKDVQSGKVVPCVFESDGLPKHFAERSYVGAADQNGTLLYVVANFANERVQAFWKGRKYAILYPAAVYKDAAKAGLSLSKAAPTWAGGKPTKAAKATAAKETTPDVATIVAAVLAALNPTK